MRGLYLVILFIFSVSATPLSLESFLAEVRVANPYLQSSKHQAVAQSFRVRPAATLDDPFFAVGPDQMPTDGSKGGMLRFQVSQNIPFPGKLGARAEAAEGRFRSLDAATETTERETIVLATQAFYRSYFNRRAIELNTTLRALLAGSIDSTKARYRTGDASHHDWLLGRVELSALDVERLRLEREGKTLVAALNEFRNQAPETPVEISPITFSEVGADPSPAELSSQPEIKAANANLSAAIADQQYARLSRLPDLVFQGMAMKPLDNMGMEAEKPNWGVMIGVNLPIFIWRKQFDLSAAAESMQNAALADRQVLENRIRTEMADAKEQLKTARDVVALYKKEVMPTTELAADNARTGYAAKRLPLTQFIEALRAKRTQELEFLASQIDVRLAETRLLYVLSAPPLLRLVPSRPMLFGSGSMGSSGMGGSDTVNMGKGLSGPTRKGNKGSGTSDAGGSGASSMGGM